MDRLLFVHVTLLRQLIQICKKVQTKRESATTDKTVGFRIEEQFHNLSNLAIYIEYYYYLI